MKFWTTIAGEKIGYRAGADAAAFLDRLGADIGNDSVTVLDFIDTLYGPENPVLDQTVFVGRGAVTVSVLADRCWHVMLDLLERKRAALGHLDPAEVAKRYNVSVSETARRLGITTAAVRQAIQSRRLPAMKRGSRYYCSDTGIDRFVVAGHGSTRGRHAVSLQVAADRLGVSTAAMRAAIRSGRIAAEKVGRRWMFTEEAVRGFTVSPRFAGGRGE